MYMPTVKSASSADLKQVVNTLVLAFVNGTFGRFMGPDANHYMKSRIIFEAMAVGSIDTGAAYLAYNTDEVCGAASLWFPPGEKPPEDAMMAALGEAVFPQRQEPVARVFETMKSFQPEEPHWYLAVLGADAHFQSQGLDATLLKHTLEICDSSQNISIYELHGFEIMDEIRIGDCPVLTQMLRPAR
ncbi:MAG: ribosomal protein S18 acetylase RimI-like enzyme [Patiriisocius sp.]|jgi:ribosomal protein S18 acetylase RimI-like enzyme